MGRKGAFLLCLAFSVQALWAKNFYLTVRRDFSPQESPEVELIYNNKLPLRARLLKPKDMDGFIKEQIDLRRAWKEPRSQVNSARPLVIGLNRSSLDLDWLRYTFNQDVRNGFKRSVGGAKFASSGTRFVEGPAKIIRAPENFELVTEFSLVPETEDGGKPFDVPGFNWYFGEQASHRTRTMSLPSQPAGFYVLQVIQGSDEGQVVVVINDLKAMIQQSDGLAIVRASDRAGRPVAGAEVKLRNVRGEWIGDGKTNASGVAEIKTGANTELVAAVKSGPSVAIIDTEFLSNDAVYPDVFIYSDRPMYKPEGVAQFKAIARERKGRMSQIIGISKPVEAKLYSVEGSEVSVGAVSKVSEFGSFHGHLPLEEAKASGIYRIQASVDGEQHIGEIRVKDYQKPLFFMLVSSRLDSVRPGMNVPLKIKAERYAGGVPGGLTARIEVLRVRFDGPEWISDAGLGETGNDVTYGFRKDQEVPIVPISVHVMEDVELGGSGQKTVNVQLPAEFPGDPGYDYKILIKVTGKDADGNFASASASLLEATSPFLVQSRTSGVYSEVGKAAWVEARALTPGGAPLGKVSGTVEFIHRPYGGEAETLDEKKIDSDDTGKFKVEVPTSKPGVVTTVLKVIDGSGNKQTSSEEILVADPTSNSPLKMVRDLTVISRRSTYLEGETAKTLVLLPEKWGEGGSSSGTIHTTIAGRKIFSQKSEKITGQTYWVNLPMTGDLGSNVYVIVSYSDPATGFVERRIQYQIVPADKILKVKVLPNEGVIAPGSDQSVSLEVVDHQNKPVKAELSVSVVDRAVLDLQPEFRPQLIDFFYPKDRLNLMTFFSNEFQTYGYSETIAAMFKPNHSFAATKPVEEPQKERDTAYWNPAVVTDSNGKASVKFRLPSNQTIWRVTAVAIDKEGRFGEGQDEFKAQTETPLTLALPNAIRKGETFQVRLAMQNMSRTKAKKVKLNVHTSASLKSAEAIAPIDVELKPGESLVQRYRLTAALDEPTSAGQITVAATVEGKDQFFEGNVKLLDGYNRTPVHEEFDSSGNLQLTMAEGETLSDPSVRVLEGFSGAIVPALRWMTAYPHGCIEQLTNTTIPNLAIADIFDPDLIAGAGTVGFWTRVGRVFRSAYVWVKDLILPGRSIQISDSQRKILADAVNNAKSGIAKIDALQTKEGYQEGQYHWFDGVEGDVYMQTYVLLSLVSVERPELLKGIELADAFKGLTRLSWKFSQEDPNAQKTLHTYIKSQLNRLKIISDPVSVADLRFALDVAKTNRATLVAYALRAAQAASLDDQKAIADLRKSAGEMLLRELDKMLAKPDDVHPAAYKMWESYVGRPGSAIALIARTLHGEKLLDKERVHRVRAALLAQFNGENFGSTYETGQILLNSTWLIREEIDGRRVGSAPEVSVGGQVVKTEPRLILAGWEIPVAVSGGTAAISVKKRNAADRVVLYGQRTIPLAAAKRVDGAFALERKFYLLNETTQGLTELREGSPVKVGDMIYVETEVQAPQSRQRLFSSAYYLMENDLPSGTSLVEEDDRFTRLAVFAKTSGWAKREEIRGRLNYYFDFKRGWNDVLREGRKIGYIVRVGYAGEFGAGVTKFSDFYDEDAFSQSGSFKLAVEPAVAR